MSTRWVLARLIQGPSIKRNLHVPVRSKFGSQVKKIHKPDAEDRELDEKLKSIRQMEQKLRQYIKEKQEQEVKAKIAKYDNLKIDSHATDDEVALLERDLQADRGDLMGIFDTGLPQSIQERLGTSAIVLLEHNWDEYLKGLAQKDGFKGLATSDVERFISMIDLKKPGNAHYTPFLEKLLGDAALSTPRLTHNLMSGYATLGDAPKVESLAKTVNLNEIVFGHIAKAYFKARDSTQVPQVIHRMHDAGLKPTKPIYTMAIQSLIQQNRPQEAFVLFDNLKYLSTESQPDVKMFNTMILAAAKLHNVNKALDLYEEMTTRPINPLVPTNEVINSLIYACSRDKTTQTKAWNFFLQQRQNGGLMGPENMRALVYLCGETGELMLVRKLIGQLCCSPATYPDDFMINALFSAYLNYDRNHVSALQSSIGPRVRAQLLENVPSSNEDFMPPFLPFTEPSDKMILAEAEAMIQFFSENRQNALQVQNRASASVGAPIVFNLLRIAIKRGTLEDVERLWAQFTIRDDRISQPVELMENDSTSHIKPHPIALVRDQDTYRVAIQAATKFRNIDFGKTVWTERGLWRRSEVFQSLPLKRRNQLDIGFAREMLKLFCECGDTESALKLVASSSKMFRWRRVHLEPLLELAATQEDFETIDAVKSLLHKYWARETKLADLSEGHKGGRDWRR